jgi:hypothetical protein
LIVIKNTAAITDPVTYMSESSPDKIELFFDRIHPSTNTYMRWHWTKVSEEVEIWHWLVKAALKGKKVRFERPVVSTDYYFTDNRDRDRGNYIPKFLIDALVKEGILKDDSCKAIKEEMPEIHLKQNIRGMKITIREVVDPQ